MQDILIALAFVGMVICPAVVRAFPFNERTEEARKPSLPLEPALACADEGAAASNLTSRA